MRARELILLRGIYKALYFQGACGCLLEWFIDEFECAHCLVSTDYIKHPLNETLREKYLKEITQLSDRAEARRRQEKARSTRCFYCMDYTKVCKDRKNWLDFMDGRGNYDIVNCIVCTGNDHWLKCSRDSESEYPGICKR